MSKRQKTFFGRKNINKLDWLLAFAFVIISLASIWVSIGVSVVNAGKECIPAFKDVGNSLGFLFGKGHGGQIAILVINAVVFYGSLVLLVLGCVYLCKKEKKDRIPGLVAEFVAAIGFVYFLSFAFELFAGSLKSVHIVFPVILIVFLTLLGVLGAFSTYLTFSSRSVELKRSEKPVVYEDAIEEPIAPAKPVEPAKPAVQEVVVKVQVEAKEQPKVEEKHEEVSEEENYKGLGARRKHPPFEKMVKKSDADTKARYKMIVEGLRQFDFNDRISIPGETFSYKREKMLFLTFSGKTLKVYFRLNAKDFLDSPIPLKDASSVKKYEQTPSFLKIKSDLAARRVVALGVQIAKENGVPKK